MPETTPDTSHLLLLLDQAAAEAARIGPIARAVSAALDQARRECQGVSAAGGEAAEGVRVEDLTTGNDK